MQDLAKEVGKLLRSKGLSLGLVESATGGLISDHITDVAGSSDYYNGSITTYGNRAKIDLVGVRQESLEKYGAVSPQVAEEMARGGRQALAADICLSDSGIAGPGGATTAKPVGLFYVALAFKDRTDSRRYLFSGDRQQNKQQAAKAALKWLKEYLLELD
ncbi:CinA family protein [Chloroflexota bacterium]